MEGTRAGANASAWPARRGRRPQHVRKLLAREPGDLASGQDQKKPGPHREGDEPKPVMHGDEKSDPSIVAGKPANGLGRPGPELVEQREGAKENTGQASTRRTLRGASVSLGLDRVRTAPNQRFAVKHPRWEPDAGMPHVRFCAGCAL